MKLEFGVRGHDFGRMTAGELAQAIASQGFTCLQLAPFKALTDPDCTPEGLNPAIARRIAADFAAQGVRIAVLGCYIDPVNPDTQLREAALTRFEQHLRLAPDFGCDLVATETGWQGVAEGDSQATRSPEAFDRLVTGVRRLAKVAESAGSIVAIEGVIRHTVHSPQKLRDLLDAVASPAVQVLLDPVNLLDAGNQASQGSIINQCFELFADRIVAVHAKDFGGPLADRLEVKPAGLGGFDWAGFMPRLQACQGTIPVLLEDLAPTEMAAAHSRLQAMAGPA